MDTDLIFDLGMHDGSDTDYYLRKGFRVVAVEADPLLAERGKVRFAGEVAAGRLHIVNKAVSDNAGEVTFFRSENTLWSSISADRTELYRQRKGVNSIGITIEAVTTSALMKEFGTPYYCKVDIEGLDTAAIASLAGTEDRPQYVSIETTRESLKAIRSELDLLRSVGYDRYKVVAQHKISRQREPNPAREGRAAGTPKPETSGLFGRDLPGKWLTHDEAIEAFRRPLLDNALTGSDPLIPNRIARAILKRIGFRAGWYDIHARRSETAD